MAGNHFYIFPIVREHLSLDNKDSKSSERYLSALGEDEDPQRSGQKIRFEVGFHPQMLAGVLVRNKLERIATEQGELPSQIKFSFTYNAPCDSFVDEGWVSRVDTDFDMDLNFRRNFEMYVQCAVGSYRQEHRRKSDSV